DLEIVHRVVRVVRRRMAGAALALAVEDLLAAQLRLAGLPRVEPSEHVELRRRREVEQLLELGHEVELAPPLERVHALLLVRRRGGRRVAVEIGGALLELGEVLDALQRTLRAEEALDVDAAKRRRIDPMAVLVRPDVADGVGRGVGVAVRVTVEARDAEARLE